jgi:hypothetical protein
MNLLGTYTVTPKEYLEDIEYFEAINKTLSSAGGPVHGGPSCTENVHQNSIYQIHLDYL